MRATIACHSVVVNWSLSGVPLMSPERRSSSRVLARHSGLALQSRPTLAALTAAVWPLITRRFSKAVLTRQPSATFHWLRMPEASCRSRPETASRSRYSLKACVSRR